MSEFGPDWGHYRSFLCVLNQGSLSGAARALGLTQPTVARHIEQLETSLGGISLFTRSPQGLAPTAAARRLAPFADTMASAAEALVRAAAGSAGEIAGVVRLSASEVIGGAVLPGILRDIRANHPGLVFEIVLSNVASDLLRREADIAIRMIRPTQKALVARRVGEIWLGLHAHPSYLERFGMPATLDDLAGHALIGFDRDVASGDLVRAGGWDARREMFAFRLDNQLAQLAVIRAGCGIGICQIGLARRAPELVPVLDDAFLHPMETWITMHEDLRGDRRMRVVFDRLAGGMSAYAATSLPPRRIDG